MCFSYTGLVYGYGEKDRQIDGQRYRGQREKDRQTEMKNGIYQTDSTTRTETEREFFLFCFDALHPSKHFFSHGGTFSCLPGLDQN